MWEEKNSMDINSCGRPNIIIQLSWLITFVSVIRSWRNQQIVTAYLHFILEPLSNHKLISELNWYIKVKYLFVDINNWKHMFKNSDHYS